MKITAIRIATRALLVFGLVLTIAAPGLAGPAEQGALAPDFTLKTLDGEQELTLSDLRGGVVYIDFWASWCGPCRRAFPEVKSLYSDYGGNGFKVLAVSLDRTTPPAIKFFDKQEVNFPGLHDAGGLIARKYGVQSIPTAIIVGPDGKIAKRMTGFDPRQLPAIRAAIEELIESTGSGEARERDARDTEVRG
jgi:thiol-disulfide isomerase/thioredoxin